MVRLFTSVGRYELRKNGKFGNYPVVILKNKEYLLGMPEMILWSGLMWQINTYGEIRDMYDKKLKEAGMTQAPDFDRLLNELEEKGLVVSDRDYIGMDALYNLRSDKKVLDNLYNDDFTTCDNIDIPCRYYPEQKPVVQAVSNLYLKKLIIFETL